VLSATLDSNTYISALNFGGTPLEVLNIARAGFIRLDVSMSRSLPITTG
jgi:hypothetical protein